MTRHRLHIGFDGKRALRNFTGLGNYSRLVIANMAREFTDDRFSVYASRPADDNPPLHPIAELPNVDFRYPLHTPLGAAAWRSLGITRQLGADGLDLYHGLSNELPLNIRSARRPDGRRVASVVTIHDLIFRRLPYCYKPADRLIYDLKYGRSARVADRIIAISERTRRDVVELYGVDPEKIDVVYQGCSELFRLPADPAADADVRRKYALPAKYIVQVGTIERRKNLELTVRALTSLPADVSLVAIGRDHYGYLARVEQIARECGVYERLRVIQGVPLADLPALYRGAVAAVYPSWYEGFGIPVLEALSCDVPLVAATGSCLEEAGGDAAIYVDPASPRDMAEALNAIISGSADAAGMVARGRIHLKKFDTALMAGNIMEVYRKALKTANES